MIGSQALPRAGSSGPKCHLSKRETSLHIIIQSRHGRRHASLIIIITQHERSPARKICRNAAHRPEKSSQATRVAIPSSSGSSVILIINIHPIHLRGSEPTCVSFPSSVPSSKTTRNNCGVSWGPPSCALSVSLGGGGHPALSLLR